MISEIEKNQDFGLTIKRGPGYGVSYSSDNSIDLPDLGARIIISKSSFSESFRMHLHFGYRSPSSKDYSRSLTLDILQVIELRDYLNECITSEIRRRENVK
jgi:hypothetical protein